MSAPAPNLPPLPSATHDDARHLEWLALGYFISSCMVAVPGLFLAVAGLFSFYFFHQEAAMNARLPADFKHLPTDGLIGSGFFSLALAGVLFLWAYLLFQARTCVRRRRRYRLILWAALLELPILFPLGLAAGVITFIVLRRPSVRTLFGN